MEPILKINVIQSNNEYTLLYKVTVTQGEDIIDSEDILRKYFEETIPYQKGILRVDRFSKNVWQVEVNK